MNIKRNLEGIFIFGSLIIGLNLQAVAQDIINTKEKMPLVAGKFTKTRELSQGTKKVTVTDFSDDFSDVNSFIGAAYYLRCGNAVENIPYSIYLANGKNAGRLYLDQDRNGFADVPGEITGADLAKHDVFHDAPKCPILA